MRNAAVKILSGMGILLLAALAGCQGNPLFNFQFDVQADDQNGTQPSPLTISPSTAFVLKDGSLTFSATGGIPPYTYSVVPPGGGSINTGTGFYTAPSTHGNAVIRVTDSAMETSDAAVVILADPNETDSSSTLNLWLKADAITMVNDGEGVSNWPDSSTSGFNATQNISNQQPTFIEDGLNGMSVVRFSNASSPGTNLTLGGNYLFSTGTGVTIFAVCRSFTDNPASSTWEDVFDFGYLAPRGYGFSYSCHNIGIYTPTGHGGKSKEKFDPNRSTDDFVILCLIIAFGANQRLYIDGEAKYSEEITLSQLTSAEIDESPSRQQLKGPVTIGGVSKTEYEGSRFFNGDMAEVIYFATAMDDDERERIEQYLMLKWGL